MKVFDAIKFKDKENRFYRFFDQYWGDMILIGSGIIVMLFYLIDSTIKRDFLHADNTLINFLFYQYVLLLGLVLTFTRIRITVSKITLLIATILIIILYFFYWEGLFGGDITLGVIDGGRTLFFGGNPYDPNNPCCTHGRDEYAHPGTYPYLPIDVIFYSITLGMLYLLSTFIFGIQSSIPWIVPSFNTMGIIVVNSSLMILTVLVACKTLPEANLESLMVGFLVIIPFLWSNVTLSTFFVVCGLYFLVHKPSINFVFRSMHLNVPYIVPAISFFTLAGLSKYLAALFIAAILVDFLRKREWKKLLFGTLVPAITALVVMLPFNIIWVLDATVGFYSSERRLEDLSMGGTIVSEIAMILERVEWIGIFSLAGFVIVGLIAIFIIDTKTRLLFVGFASLNVITGFSAQFFGMLLYMLTVFDRLLITDQQKLNSIRKKELQEKLRQDDKY
ncbi:MAG: hypothetical protein ACXADA_04945 [Candidatus Hodarchaeales archaeon]|jgi:hypothetical protein